MPMRRPPGYKPKYIYNKRTRSQRRINHQDLFERNINSLLKFIHKRRPKRKPNLKLKGLHTKKILSKKCFAECLNQQRIRNSPGIKYAHSYYPTHDLYLRQVMELTDFRCPEKKYYIFSKEKFPEKDDEFLFYEEEDILIFSNSEIDHMDPYFFVRKNSGLETNKTDCPIASAAASQSQSSSTEKITREITEEEYLELKSKARKFDEISGICG